MNLYSAPVKGAAKHGAKQTLCQVHFCGLLATVAPLTYGRKLEPKGHWKGLRFSCQWTPYTELYRNAECTSEQPKCLEVPTP